MQLGTARQQDFGSPAAPKERPQGNLGHGVALIHNTQHAQPALRALPVSSQSPNTCYFIQLVHCRPCSTFS